MWILGDIGPPSSLNRVRGVRYGKFIFWHFFWLVGWRWGEPSPPLLYYSVDSTGAGDDENLAMGVAGKGGGGKGKEKGEDKCRTVGKFF